MDEEEEEETGQEEFGGVWHVEALKKRGEEWRRNEAETMMESELTVAARGAAQADGLDASTAECDGGSGQTDEERLKGRSNTAAEQVDGRSKIDAEQVYARINIDAMRVIDPAKLAQDETMKFVQQKTIGQRKERAMDSKRAEPTKAKRRGRRAEMNIVELVQEVVEITVES